MTPDELPSNVFTIADLFTLEKQLEAFREDYSLIVSSVPKDAERFREMFGTNGAMVGDLVFRLAARVAELEAELAATPPTLEWLTQQFGEPDEIMIGDPCWEGKFYWSMAAQHCRASMPGNISVLTTRAAVLAAAAAKGEA